MAEKFWSQWGMSLAIASVGFFIAFLVLKQYKKREHLCQLAWTAGLFLFTPAALIECNSEFPLSWGFLVYCICYVVVVSLMGSFGIEKAYLVFGKKTLGYSPLSPHNDSYPFSLHSPDGSS